MLDLEKQVKLLKSQLIKLRNDELERISKEIVYNQYEKKHKVKFEVVI